MAISKPLFGSQINQAHPLSQGIVSCYLFNEGAGTTVYDSSGKGHHMDFTTGSPLPTWTSDSNGNALNFTATGENSSTTIVSNITDFSILFGFRQKTGNPSGYAELGTLNGTTFYSCSTATNFRAVNGPFAITTPANGAVGTGIPVADTDFHQVLFTRVGTVESVYLDGVFNVSAPAVNGAGNTVLNVPGAVLSRGMYGNMSFIYVWNRTMSAQEISYLNAFPFAMFDTNVNALNPFDPSSSNTLTVTGFPI